MAEAGPVLRSLQSLKVLWASTVPNVFEDKEEKCSKYKQKIFIYAVK